MERIAASAQCGVTSGSSHSICHFGSEEAVIMCSTDHAMISVVWSSDDGTSSEDAIVVHQGPDTQTAHCTVFYDRFLIHIGDRC